MTVIPGTTGVKLGLKRGGTEIRQAFTYWPDLAQTLAFPVLSVAVLLLLRGHHLPGTALPPAMRALELNGQWRLPEVLLVLVLWSAAGLAAAPPVLRRMARKESGSRVAARRERAMLRAT
jgi:hypothetical protein